MNETKSVSRWNLLLGLGAMVGVGSISFWLMNRRETADVDFGEDLAWLSLDRGEEIADSAGELPDWDFLDSLPVLEALSEKP
jgi:hypothetical protein